ncbi:MAG: hypothetical protein ACJ76Y_11175 [Thermoanaerobaculia bacterium]
MKSFVCALLLLAGAGRGAHAAQLAVPPPAHPARVTTNFYFNSVTDVDAVSESFEADFYLFLTWEDPRLASKDPALRAQGESWEPQIDLVNALDQRSRWAAPVLEHPSPGRASLLSTYSGKFRAPMDLRDFPFDRQVLPIYVESAANIEDLAFDGGMETKARGDSEKGWPADPRNVLSDRVRLPEWDIEEIRVRHTPEYYGFIDQTFSRFRIEIHVARRPGFYVWKIIAIEALLVILSWIVFFLDPGNLGDRSTVAVTLLLATVAFSYVVGGITPRTAYLTLLDDFLLGSFFVIFLAAAECVIVFRLHRRGGGEKATKAIDRWSVFLFPAGYVLFNALLWARAVAAYLG